MNLQNLNLEIDRHGGRLELDAGGTVHIRGKSLPGEVITLARLNKSLIGEYLKIYAAGMEAGKITDDPATPGPARMEAYQRFLSAMGKAEILEKKEVITATA